MRRLAPLTICFLLLLVCPAISTAATVDVYSGGEYGSQFSPKDVTVNPGDTVTWTNDGGFDSVLFQDGTSSDAPYSSYQRTFNHVGTFLYRSGPRSSSFTEAGQMNGSVTVAGIGGQVIEDADGDGVQDPGETGLSGVSVHLANSGGPVAVVTTDSDGYWEFGPEPTDTSYTVTYDEPEGYKNTGTSTIHVNYVADSAAAGNNFLAKPTGDINGKIYGDTNANGTADPGENGLAGVQVFIDANTDGVAQSTERSAVTDGGGNFDLPLLRAGTYNINYVVPAGYDNTGASPRSVILTAGETHSGVLFYAAPGTGTISGSVFHDPNGNGTVDSGEAGLQGVTVGLDSTGDGSPDSIQTTGADGSYAFTGLPSGTYRVLVQVPDGYESTGTGAYDVTLAHGQGVGTRDFFIRASGEGSTGGDGSLLPGTGADNPFVTPPKPFGDGTSGPDTINGTAGRDRLLGHGGNDKLFGFGGNDFIDGGAGNDWLDGGAGSDHIVGQTGNDRIYGGAGKDLLYGGAGNDRIYGGAGNDTIVAGSGKDYVDGGPGNDVIKARDGQKDVVRCGPGRDTARVDKIDVVSGCEHVTRL